MPDGSTVYTRDGAFKTSATGQIVTSDGYPLQGGFQPVPAGTTNITIGASGNVTYTTANGSTTYQVQLARFNNEGGLQSMGSNLYQETSASGRPSWALPTKAASVPSTRATSSCPTSRSSRKWSTSSSPSAPMR